MRNDKLERQEKLEMTNEKDKKIRNDKLEIRNGFK